MHVASTFAPFAVPHWGRFSFRRVPTGLDHRGQRGRAERL